MATTSTAFAAAVPVLAGEGLGAAATLEVSQPLGAEQEVAEDGGGGGAAADDALKGLLVVLGVSGNSRLGIG